MVTLLKDMPIHMERIENNYLLGESIKDELESVNVDTSLDSSFENSFIQRVLDELESAEFEIESGKVKIDNKQDLAIAIFKALQNEIEDEIFPVSNSGDVAIAIREKLTDFVNQNYEWKGAVVCK